MSKGGVTAVPSSETLSRAAIAQVDPSDQLGAVLALPEHLRDAVWRVDSAIMQDWDTSAGLVVAGMGGSAIGGAWFCANCPRGSPSAWCLGPSALSASRSGNISASSIMASIGCWSRRPWRRRWSAL